MDISKIPVGNNPPFEVNVIIEIPLGGVPVKYELDKEAGAMDVDRFLHTAMYYPCNCGFIPRPILIEQIAHFFEHYKDLEPNKWGKVQGWCEAEEATRLIEQAIARAKSKGG